MLQKSFLGQFSADESNVYNGFYYTVHQPGKRQPFWNHWFLWISHIQALQSASITCFSKKIERNINIS